MYEALQSNKDVVSEGEMPTFGQDGGITLSMLYGKDYDDPDCEILLSQLTFEETNTLITTCISNTSYS